MVHFCNMEKRKGWPLLTNLKYANNLNYHRPPTVEV